MSPKLYLFLPARSNELNALNSVVLNWVYEDTSNELKLAQGQLADVVKTAINHHIIVVIPGEDVLFLTAVVPGKDVKRIQQAVPYVLEDSVIDDVDNLYFAVNKSASSDSDSQYDVSVINKQYFESIILQLKTAGIQPNTIMADYWLLPENNLLLNEDRVIFNAADLKFSSPSTSVINLNDDELISEQSINLIECGNETDKNPNINRLLTNPNVKKEHWDAHPLLYLAKNHKFGNGVNLLQGNYKKKKNWSQDVKMWLPVAALFLIWISIQGATFIVDYISLSKKNTTLNAEIVNVYKKTFPDSRRIIDAKAQMKQKLNDLKKRNGQSGRSFSKMLSGTAGIFNNTRGFEIKTLRYYDGRINLEFQIASLQALDKLKNELTNTAGYRVEIQNASSGKENVTARLQIIGDEL